MNPHDFEMDLYNGSTGAIVQPRQHQQHLVNASGEGFEDGECLCICVFVCLFSSQGRLWPERCWGSRNVLGSKGDYHPCVCVSLSRSLSLSVGVCVGMHVFLDF